MGGRYRYRVEDGVGAEHKGHSSFRETETLGRLTLKRLDISHWMSSWPVSSAEKSGSGWRTSPNRNYGPKEVTQRGCLEKEVSQGSHLGTATAEGLTKEEPVEGQRQSSQRGGKKTRRERCHHHRGSRGTGSEGEGLALELEEV